MFSFELVIFLLNKSLDNRNGPKLIYILKLEVLSYFIIPNISLILKLISKRIWIIFTWSKLKFKGCLSLIAASDIRVIAIIKSLSLKQFFNTFYVIENINRHILVLFNILVKWNEIYMFYLINKISLRHLCHKCPISNYQNK